MSRLSAYGKPNTLKEDLASVVKINESVANRNVDNVVNKWGRHLQAIKNAGTTSDYKLMTTAILLENTSNYLTKRENTRILNEATQPSDTSFFKRYAINLLSAVVPNLIAEDKR